MNQEISDVPAGFRKDRGTRDQISNIRLLIKKAGEFQENIYFSFIDWAKSLLLYGSQQTGKFLKRWEYLTCFLRNLYASQEAIVEPDMEQWTGSKLGKEYIIAIYCHLASLTYMQSTSCEVLDWMKDSWNQDNGEKYQYPQICRWHHPYGRKQTVTKEPLDESERGEW